MSLICRQCAQCHTAKTQWGRVAIFWLFLAFFFADVSTPSRAQQVPHIPDLDRVRLAEVFHLADKLQDRVWKDWHTAPFAVLLVTPDYEFLVRHLHPSDDFVSSGYDRLLHSPVYYRKRQFATNLLATLRQPPTTDCLCCEVYAVPKGTNTQMSHSSLEVIPHFLRLSDRIGTAGQPSAEQFAIIKEAGYQVVVNLRPPADTLPNERALVEDTGMAYVSIPVIWDAPTIENVQQFFATMQANEDKRVFVHCAMNMRVSAFLYLYRVIKQNVAPEVAVQDLHRIWEPNSTWQQLIEQVLEQNSIIVE